MDCIRTIFGLDISPKYVVVPYHHRIMRQDRWHGRRTRGQSRLKKTRIFEVNRTRTRKNEQIAGSTERSGELEPDNMTTGEFWTDILDEMTREGEAKKQFFGGVGELYSTLAWDWIGPWPCHCGRYHDEGTDTTLMSPKPHK